MVWLRSPKLVGAEQKNNNGLPTPIRNGLLASWTTAIVVVVTAAMPQTSRAAGLSLVDVSVTTGVIKISQRIDEVFDNASPTQTKMIDLDLTSTTKDTADKTTLDEKEASPCPILRCICRPAWVGAECGR